MHHGHPRRIALAVTLSALALLHSPAARADITLFVIADTHYGYTVPDSSQQNQLQAIQSLPGTPYPVALGGVVATPDAIVMCGDLVHDDQPPNPYALPQFLNDYAGNGCSGTIQCPVYECSGNHDSNAFREIIARRHGELLYGAYVKGVFLQSLDDLPTVQSIAYVNDRLNALPQGTPIILFHHRPLSNSPGYIDEWAPAAVQAYRDMLVGKNVIAVLFGHDHYSRAFNWEGRVDTYKPGSIRHSPGTVFPESLLVIRISENQLVAASWIFGNNAVNNQHVWVGGAWGWTSKKPVQLNGASVTENPGGG